ncbi:MAG: hypothetical protein JWM80_374 [Cyanobacteria bacterium RYN_339]|nr:hypothetical protein [Cyanobacteria bacterium RYN_339]
MPSPVVNALNVSTPRPAVVNPDASTADAGNSYPEMVVDELDLHITPEAQATLDNVETKVTYWTFGAEALRQVSLMPAFFARHANGALAFLELHRFAKLATYFEVAERGSKWLYLDTAHLKALEVAASRLTRCETALLTGARAVGRVLPWAAPAFAAWDVTKAIREPNAGRRTAAVGNAAISVLAALTSFAFPAFSMVVVGVQCIDAMKGSHLARAIGKVMQRDWDETRARQAAI